MESTEANPDLLLNLRQQATVRRRINDALRQNALALYRPHLKQAAFHNAWQFKRRMVRAGNRFGKSQMGCAEDVAWLLGERPWLAASSAGRRGGIPQHPVKLLTITTDWDIVDRIWTTQRGDKPGKAWRYLPPGFVKHSKRNHNGAICEIECRNGAQWFFDTQSSYDNDPSGAESADWDAIHVDEPCGEQMFKAHARGMIDRGGCVWFTLTPLSEPWISDYFFPQDTGGVAREGVWAIDGTTYDNPYLSAADIAEYEKTLTADERQCRIYGKPLHLAGLIYKEFSWARHVLTKLPKGWTAWHEPPPNWCVYVQIDPHPQTPHCVLFCAVSPTGQRIYFADLFIHTKVPQLAQQIRAVEGDRLVPRRECDWLAWEEHPVDESTMADELAANGVYVEKASRALEYGILTAQKSLMAEPQQVWFTPACKRTLWEIQRYSWDPKGTNKPIDKDDHAMECFYRMELMRPGWVERQQVNPVGDIVIDRPEIETADLEFALV